MRLDVSWLFSQVHNVHAQSFTVVGFVVRACSTYIYVQTCTCGKERQDTREMRDALLMAVISNAPRRAIVSVYALLARVYHVVRVATTFDHENIPSTTSIPRRVPIRDSSIKPYEVETRRGCAHHLDIFYIYENRRTFCSNNHSSSCFRFLEEKRMIYKSLAFDSAADDHSWLDAEAMPRESQVRNEGTSPCEKLRLYGV